MGFKVPYLKGHEPLARRKAAVKVSYADASLDDIENDNYKNVNKTKTLSHSSTPGSSSSGDKRPLSLTQRSLGASKKSKSSSTLVDKDDVPESVYRSDFYLTPATSKFLIQSKPLYKPFVIPFLDPVKRANEGRIDPNQYPLGMRPKFNSAMMLKALYDPDADDAFVLFRPKRVYSAKDKMKMKSLLYKKDENKKALEEFQVAVVVDPRLSKVLRPHQVEGVRFLYECVTGQRGENIHGCIMADEMGLGKTLQCITLLWTLLKQSPTPCKPTCERCIIVCPSTLVKNWANELVKWLGPGSISPIVCDHKASVALGSAKKQFNADLQRFVSSGKFGAAKVLIISYETLRMNISLLEMHKFGLMLCDEGHRLKNSENQTYKALNKLDVERRVILTGTPVQNDLSEYFSLLNFANPNLLGTPNEFRRKYENPILRGRDADATQTQRDQGDERLKELNSTVNKLIIRRTNDLLNKYLPTKYEHVVFCKLSPIQQQLYELFVQSKALRKELKEKDTLPLKHITMLKKLVNSPCLLNLPDDLEGSELIVPELALEKAEMGSRAYRGTSRGGHVSNVHVEWSGKLMILHQMLKHIKKTTDDKVVLISNYTQTLDLFEKLALSNGYSFSRLDGSMNSSKRAKLVDTFNNNEDPFLFLLSSKAGGCGINLIGANRLVLFDPDWNPASDQQALARVWRDGQKKTCFIYRLIAAGTIEEKIFQRQNHKQTLSSCVVDEEVNAERYFSVNELKDIFKLNKETTSETHDTFRCKLGCDRPDRPNTTYGDLSSWTHFSIADRHRFADSALKAAAECRDLLSLVFQFKSHEPIKVVRKVEESEDEESDKESEDSEYVEEH